MCCIRKQAPLKPTYCKIQQEYLHQIEPLQKGKKAKSLCATRFWNGTIWISFLPE